MTSNAVNIRKWFDNDQKPDESDTHEPVGAHSWYGRRSTISRIPSTRHLVFEGTRSAP